MKKNKNTSFLEKKLKNQQSDIKNNYNLSKKGGKKRWNLSMMEVI